MYAKTTVAVSGENTWYFDVSNTSVDRSERSMSFARSATIFSWDSSAMTALLSGRPVPRTGAISGSALAGVLRAHRRPRLAVRLGRRAPVVREVGVGRAGRTAARVAGRVDARLLELQVVLGEVREVRDRQRDALDVRQDALGLVGLAGRDRVQQRHPRLRAHRGRRRPRRGHGLGRETVVVADGPLAGHEVDLMARRVEVLARQREADLGRDDRRRLLHDPLPEL